MPEKRCFLGDVAKLIIKRFYMKRTFVKSLRPCKRSGYNKPVVQFMIAALRVVHSYRAAKFIISFPF